MREIQVASTMYRDTVFGNLFRIDKQKQKSTLMGLGIKSKPIHPQIEKG